SKHVRALRGARAELGAEFEPRGTQQAGEGLPTRAGLPSLDAGDDRLRRAGAAGECPLGQARRLTGPAQQGSWGGAHVMMIANQLSASSREQRGFLVILSNGTPVARLEPVAGAPAASLWEALAAWRSGGPDPALAEALERVGEADRAVLTP